MNLDAYKNCTLCPRNCKVDRTQGKLGFCGESATCSISFIGPHFGEEPSFTGACGSGTLFFSGCSSQCFFCQNYQISLKHDGRAITPAELLAEVKTLIRKEVHNLNFVTPDHFWPHVRNLCLALREEGIRIPTLFNCSGYQKPEKIPEYAEFMDMFLPDFKFAEPELAQKCMGDARYPEIALAAIRSMVKEKGFLEPWDPSGDRPAKRGVLVRHLVLPGHVENSLKVLKILHREFGPGIPVSVMSQFQPMPECCKRNELHRMLHAKEYEQVLALVIKLGFERVYTQELVEKTAFLPNFNDPDDPFPGNKDRTRDGG
ncbi:MAG TPA: radical SAM protein [Candidatus Omnitrophota bacterium]|nr:radical SAM protein [Candidatus Omnitrophota bacterium]HPS37417.1 radical SAM protein [Candidatus Omnitrophota bacterium]